MDKRSEEYFEDSEGGGEDAASSKVFTRQYSVYPCTADESYPQIRHWAVHSTSRFSSSPDALDSLHKTDASFLGAVINEDSVRP